MGPVHEARHVALGRTFAVKVLDARGHPGAVAIERFRREARAASAIGHPSIVEVLDIDSTPDGHWYIVMELLEGEDLRARLTRMGRLRVDEALEVARHVGSALDAAHARGIVHRDLKPENVFLCSRPGATAPVKLLDFGVSKIRDAAARLTEPGEIVGTPDYMAPEQILEACNVDHRADLFALGAVLYETLTGEPPFRGTTPRAVLASILADDPPDPRLGRPEIGVEAAAVLGRALEKDPGARFQSGAELVLGLEQAVERDRSRPAVPRSRSAGRSRPSPRGTYGLAHLAFAFALGMAACGAAALLEAWVLGG
jgi:serine/threonine-protein kinase